MASGGSKEQPIIDFIAYLETIPVDAERISGALAKLTKLYPNYHVFAQQNIEGTYDIRFTIRKYRR